MEGLTRFSPVGEQIYDRDAQQRLLPTVQQRTLALLRTSTPREGEGAFLLHGKPRPLDGPGDSRRRQTARGQIFTRKRRPPAEESAKQIDFSQTNDVASAPRPEVFPLRRKRKTYLRVNADPFLAINSGQVSKYPDHVRLADAKHHLKDDHYSNQTVTSLQQRRVRKSKPMATAASEFVPPHLRGGGGNQAKTTATREYVPPHRRHGKDHQAPTTLASEFLPPHLRHRKDDQTTATAASEFVPPHLCHKKDDQATVTAASEYLPPHLRHREDDQAPVIASEYLPPHLRPRKGNQALPSVTQKQPCVTATETSKLSSFSAAPTLPSLEQGIQPVEAERTAQNVVAQSTHESAAGLDAAHNIFAQSAQKSAAGLDRSSTATPSIPKYTWGCPLEGPNLPTDSQPAIQATPTKPSKHDESQSLTLSCPTTITSAPLAASPITSDSEASPTNVKGVSIPTPAPKSKSPNIPTATAQVLSGPSAVPEPTVSKSTSHNSSSHDQTRGEQKTYPHLAQSAAKASSNKPAHLTAKETSTPAFKVNLKATPHAQNAWAEERNAGIGHHRSKPPRRTQWPTPAEMRAGPKHDKVSNAWGSGSNSAGDGIDRVRADNGQDGAKSTKKRDADDDGYKLADWSGNWAPAPLDWDSRPAYRGTQSTAHIEDWITQHEKAMEGLTREVGVSEVTVNRTKYAFSSHDIHISGGDSQPTMGEIAPRYWIPESIEGVALQIFWHMHLASPLLSDEYKDSKPWWESYPSKPARFLLEREHPHVAGPDPQEPKQDRIAREKDAGSNVAAMNRNNREKRIKDEKRYWRKSMQEDMAKRNADYNAQPHPHAPQLNIFIRSAVPADMTQICAIYNHYVTFSVCCPEIIPRSVQDMHRRLRDIKENKLPYLVAVQRGGRSEAKNLAGEGHVLPDRIVGFAFADDFNSRTGMYRFAAEVEVYTHKDFYLKGVARCLMDKMMRLLDPDYPSRGGYDCLGDLERGPSRRLTSILCNIPYDAGDRTRITWLNKWMTRMGFEQVGDIKNLGIKEGKNVNLAIFQAKTGTDIDPKMPPISSGY
ncbi:hypothetical protein LTR50_006902 [Elasticomyces elasticus]|nr:hypothetical protein LTR50_006902 [Elasticomyces elasticus]